MDRVRLLFSILVCAVVLIGTHASGVAGFLSLIVSPSGQTQSPGLRRITNTSEEGFNLNPSISGDGRVIAFESTEDIAGIGGGNHFRAIRANVIDEPPGFSQIAATRAVTPAVSEDGSRITFSSTDDPLGANPDGNSEIFLFDGVKLAQLTNTLPGSIADRTTQGSFQPSTSDDGRFIAFSSNRDLAGQNADGNLEIFVYDSVSKAFIQLTSSSGIVGCTDAKISGNGALVAYIHDIGLSPSPSRDLIVQPRSGGEFKVLAAGVSSLAMTYGRAISDDGTRIVFSSQTAPNTTQVFLYDARGGAGLRQITSLGARVTDVPLHPSISGDGTRISFVTRRNVNGGNSDGSVELYLYDLPTATFSRLTAAPAGASAEVISSLNDDGTVVAFNFPRVISGGITNADLANNSEIYLASASERPAFGELTILNGASLGNEAAVNKAVAPDSIAVARGSLLANSTLQSQRLPNGTFPTLVGGTSVTVNGRPSQLFFVSPSQVNFLIPPQTEIGTADVIVTNSEGFPSRGSVATLRSAAGIFTKSGDGTGEALALNSDTLQAAPFDPSGGKLRLTIFGTAMRNASQILVTIGGQMITPEFVLPSPDMPGLDELHLRVPVSLKGAGVVTLSMQSDGYQSNLTSIGFSGGDILINEVLADPPGAAPTDLSGDTNRDGVRSSSDDEFIELVNSTSRDIDLSGYQLLTRNAGTAGETLRHSFAAGTIVAARTAVLVFGGGAPNPGDPAFGGALVLKASTGGLSLSNIAGIVSLRDSTGGVANIFEYGGATGLSGGSNQSLTRSPDITGAFTLHTAATGAGGRLFSPGTHVDGTPFATIPIARIDVSPLMPAIDAGAKQQFTARAFDADNREMTGVIFFWQSSKTSVATIDQTGLALSSEAGVTEITASARGVQSAAIALTVRVVPRVLTRIEVTPNVSTIPATGGQQFIAKAIDQFGNEMTGLNFFWESTAPTVAVIDQSGFATGIMPGQSTIKATAQGVEGSAVLSVTAPTLIVNEVLADPPAGPDGDANHDGIRDGAQDEFIELINSNGASLDISGWTVRTHSTTNVTETVRHTFASGANAPAGEAMVVFGGGNFDPAGPLFGCAQVVKASTGGLSLTNSGLTILIRDAAGNLVTSFSYGGTTGLNGGNGQSLTRSPDVSGTFMLHTTPAAAGGRKLSAGLRLDGTPFGTCPGQPASVNISPAAAAVNVGESVSFTAQAFDQFGRRMTEVPITFSSDNITVASIVSTTSDPMNGVFTAIVAAHQPGVARIIASANDGTSSATSPPASLTVTGPALTINDVSINEGDTGTNTLTFLVSLSEPAPAGGVKFDIATADGTALVVNNDYLARSLINQTIAAGTVNYSFNVTVNGDTMIEPNETFFVNVTNVSGASITKAQGRGTILNDDNPILTVNDVAAAEGNSGITTFRFTVSSSLPAPPGGITFDIGTANGTALANGGDYLARSLTNQSIPTGEFSYVFEVRINGDLLVEPHETFFVNLSNLSPNALIGNGQGVGTIENDDTANLIISQVYPGGGLSGATFTNDFIEIFNRDMTTVDFSLTPYSVQFLSTSASAWTKTDLTRGSIGPGGYFLIRESSGGTNGAALPVADASGSINLTSTTAGKVALVAGTTLLTGNCPGDDGSVPFNPLNVSDLVGYGGAAASANHCYEGNGPAQFTLSNNTVAAYRRAGGCADTNDNATDFFTLTPSPRNSSSALNNCAGGVTPALSINDVMVTEGNSGTVTATFTVALSLPAQGEDVSFDIATVDGSATTANGDYVAKSLIKQIIPAGHIAYTFNITITGDAAIERDEQFLVNVTNVTGATVADAEGLATIQNDDFPGLVISDVSGSEGDAGTKTFSFSVSLSAPAPGPVTFDIATQNGSATTADNDYVLRALAGQVIPTGQQTYQFDVTVNGDMDIEPDENFFVNVTNVTGAIVLDAQAQGTIQNDDSPILTINDVSITEGNSGTTTFTFIVSSTRPAPEGGITFDIATADGTAQDDDPNSEDNDYVPRHLNNQIIAPGQTTYSFNVAVNGDLLVEPNETFFINIANASNASIGDSQGQGTIQNDDAANLLISQIYGGGNNAGATYQNDFVEIFNRGTTTIDFAVTPYSVQYAAATSNFTTNKTDITSGLLLPGHYFLIQEAGGTTNGAVLPAPNIAAGTINLSATSGKVARVLGTTALTGSGCPFAPAIIDFLGYGTTANCSETTPVTVSSTNANARSVIRMNSCADTNNNSSDFSNPTIAPVARNTATTPTICP